MDVSDERINFNDQCSPSEVEDNNESYNLNGEISSTFSVINNEIYNDHYVNHMYTNLPEDDFIVNSFENFEEGSLFNCHSFFSNSNTLSDSGVCSPSMDINLIPLPIEYEEKNLPYYLNQPNIEILSSNNISTLYDTPKNDDDKNYDNHRNVTIKLNKSKKNRNVGSNLKKNVEIIDTTSESHIFALGKGNKRINKLKNESRKCIDYSEENIEDAKKLPILSNLSNHRNGSSSKFPPLILTEEEKKLCLKEGVHFPEYYPLTKNEEKELKRIRRKIRNKKSAQESRKRKQDYIKALEEKVCKCEYENKHLKYRLECSSNENKNIIVQLRKLQSEINKDTIDGSNLSTSLVITFLSVYFLVNHFFLSLSKNSKISQNGNICEQIHFTGSKLFLGSVLNNNVRFSQPLVDFDYPRRCVVGTKTSKYHNKMSRERLSYQLKNINDKNNLLIVDLSRSGLLSLPNEINKVSHQIKHLILDGNYLNEYSFNNHYFPRLESLSLNSNNIKNVGVFLQIMRRQTPNLTFISLIENPGWPHPITYLKNIHLYKKYCKIIINFFPKLLFLDSLKVCK
ncbi:Basic-leucine zipper domain and Transcription factor, Skn-1-like, DNA-binding domain-containing protein [Strongyloides ratti]|uniref:Basic-leucine zipper domain and Transcription factor, Skn-1-like, DNA-binding domain-containing protein n=1 Tax=Strongyloides ratti TaxID=34506 RepID=A0A090L5F5_STRRB|nr:Basic-leucine zipper domain and Transcription factor, Skn-1-like, DNA-binding domain-containing protein [Strongyloides ratti]CEF65036.1 Basic-leucine zipper domain and Transcription factor, Skn-1-like, DNA-binding domain-containing protein [Strongyloides ratti]